MTLLTKKQVAARCLSALLLSSCLASCAVYTPPTITAHNGAALAPAAIELVSAEADSGLRSSFADALRRSLSSGQFPEQEGAALVADYGIAARQAESSIEGIAAEKDEPFQSAARESGWLESCEATRLRASLAIFQRSNGTLVYRGEAETDFCKGQDFAVDALARLLVEDMVSGR